MPGAGALRAAIRAGAAHFAEQRDAPRDPVAAGDVAAIGGRRSPHWASAVQQQGRTAAATLMHGDAAPVPSEVPYFWTEQFGVELKICGQPQALGAPIVLDGALAERRAVLQWTNGDSPVAAATIHHRVPVAHLKRLTDPPRPPVTGPTGGVSA